MNNKTFYILYIFIIFSLFIKFNNSQSPTFYFKESLYNSYSQYPVESSQYTCQFNFFIEIYVDYKSISGTNQLGQSINITTYTKIDSNNTYGLFAISDQQSFGNYQINIKATFDYYTSNTYFINYTCEAIPDDYVFNINYRSDFEKRPYSFDGTPDYYSLVLLKIEGLKNSLQKLCIDDVSNCISSSICNNCFLITLSDNQKNNITNLQLSDNIKRTLLISNSQRELKTNTVGFQSIFKNSLDSLNQFSNISRYSNSFSINTMGVMEYPLYTFKVNSSVFNPFYLSTDGTNDYTKYDSPLPISSDSSGITYVGKISTNPWNFYRSSSAYKTLTSNILFNIDVYNLALVNLQTSTLSYSSTSPITFYAPIKVTNYIESNVDIYKLYTQFRGYSFFTYPPYGIKNKNVLSIDYESTYFVYSSSIISKMGLSLQNVYIKDNTNVAEVPLASSQDNSISRFSYNFKNLYDNTFLFTIQFNATENIHHIELFGNIFRSESIASIDSNFITYQIVADFTTMQQTSSGPTLVIRKKNDSLRTFILNQYISPSYSSIFYQPFNSVNILSIKSIEFLYNNMDITNKTISNKMFISFSEPVDKNIILSLFIYDKVSIDIKNPRKHFYAKWNNELGLFEIKFIVKANSIPNGYLPYSINFEHVYSKSISNSLLPDNYQLKVISNNLDNSGPIFSNITITSKGWQFEIQDLINGFKNGYIVIMGRNDYSIYNYSIDTTYLLEGDMFTGSYEIVVPTYSLNFQQFYDIKEVVLFDNQNYNSTFISIGEVNILSNPFRKFIGNITYYSFYRQPINSSLSDTTPPSLVSFDTPTLSNNIVSVGFQVTDLESFIDYNIKPIVYFKNLEQRIEQCVPLFSSNKTHSNFTCIKELPLDFGQFSISIYGVTNYAGYSSGFSEDRIKDLTGSYPVLNLPVSINPIISSTNVFSNLDTTLWIIGKRLSSNNTRVTITYLENNISETVTPTTIYSNIISIPIKKTNLGVILTVMTSDGTSNQYQTTPTHLFSFSNDELPTNPPLSCKNNCGGNEKGYCSSSGCICYSPWIGDDCSSKVITIPQPTLNSTDPTTEFNLNNDNNQFFRSLVSIISIRELNIYNEIVENYYFDKWIQTNISDSQTQYFTNITTNSNDLVNVTILLEWFKDTTNITFANQNLLMYPSTMKYTIRISKYPFRNQLNSLQLVLSASLETNDESVDCSSQQYGSTSNVDNSDYVKIQIDKNSLYGRLIKRGIVDYNIRSLSNDFNIKDEKYNLENNRHSSNKLIGINIGHYTNFALLDPDFSVLIDQNSANSNSPNSICSKSGLTKSQIAGIIVGSVVFFVVIVIAIGSVIYRSQGCLPIKIFIYKLFKKSKI